MTHQDSTFQAIERLPIELLINYHKQEGTEELTYMTILITLMIGIIGYLGTAPKVRRSARLLILIIYSMMHYGLVEAFTESMRIHSALHEEIGNYAREQCPEDHDPNCPPAYNALKVHMKPHNILRQQLGWYALYGVMFLTVLSIGNDPLFKWPWLDRLLSRIWKMFGSRE